MNNDRINKIKRRLSILRKLKTSIIINTIKDCGIEDMNRCKNSSSRYKGRYLLCNVSKKKKRYL